MAATKVLDAFALMAFFEDEPGADLVRSLLIRAEEGGIKLFMNVVNLGEVWYAVARASSPDEADRIIQVIQGMAIELVDVDWNLARLAAGYKAKAKIPYADCFAAALAESRSADIVTGDQEFNLLKNEIKITWT